MSIQGGRNPVIRINRDWCKKCGVCQVLCPKQVLTSDELGQVSVAKPDQCIDCKICERICPDFAITVGGQEHE